MSFELMRTRRVPTLDGAFNDATRYRLIEDAATFIFGYDIDTARRRVYYFFDV